MVDVKSGYTTFFQLGETDERLKFEGTGSRKRIRFISNEWPPIPEMSTWKRTGIDVFHLLAYGLAEVFPDVEFSDQETLDALALDTVVQHAPSFSPWASLAHTLRELSKKKEGTCHSLMERMVRRLMGTYSLLRFGDGSLGLGRGDLRVGDKTGMVQPHGPRSELAFFPPAILMRPLGGGSLADPSSMKVTQNKMAEEGEWRIIGPALFLSDSKDLLKGYLIKGVLL
jgi:hypothetical protein